MVRPCIYLFISILLVSCATMPESKHVERIPFPVAEYKALSHSGTGIITGEAFIKLSSSGVTTGAGNEVRLYPVTSYSNQWYEVANFQKNDVRIGPPDPQIEKYTRSTIADGQGHFTFKKVPPGEYFVVAEVSWLLTTTEEGTAKMLSTIVRKIVVKNGEETHVMCYANFDA